MIRLRSIGKFEIWAQLLDELKLQGNEHILDLGCGRGAVLLMVAGLLSTGKAVGVDLWRSEDQSGNAMAVTGRNAALEEVEQRVGLQSQARGYAPSIHRRASR